MAEKFNIKAPTELDFEKEGLMIGLEFHQQLLAPYFGEHSNAHLKKYGSKLFCPCPAVIRDDDPDFTVERQLRAVSGETGKIDIAAKFEKLKKQKLVYEGYHDTTCLVELDEEPILPINSEALFRSIAIASKLFHLSIFDELLVNRKTIVDGSNTSGFQRTMQIGYGNENSYITVNDKKILIYQANLEEDSAKNTGNSGLTRHFRLDRLGTPLIEIATAPDMRTPQEVADTALRIGTLLRTTGFVKRGLGTIRQDINVSIKRGTRIEIKGVQELDLLPLYVRNEAIRQVRMLEFLELAKARGFDHATIDEIKAVDVTSKLKKTKAKFVQKAIKNKQNVIGARLPKLNGLIGFELQPNYRIGSELSEISKVTSGAGGILHSDELPKFGITQTEKDTLAKTLKLGKDDGFMLIVGPAKIGKISVENVKTVFKMWLDLAPLPPEVRAPRADGTTGFLRPLPGQARMYPETDSPPLHLDGMFMQRLKSLVFEMPEKREQRYLQEYKLPSEIAARLTNHPDNMLFEDIVQQHKVQPTLVATTMLQLLTDLRRKGLNVQFISDAHLHLLFEQIANGVIPSSSIEQILTGIATEKAPLTPQVALDKYGVTLLSEDALREIVDQIADAQLAIIQSKEMRAMGAVMGMVMAEIQGGAEGKLVSKLVREAIQFRLAK